MITLCEESSSTRVNRIDSVPIRISDSRIDELLILLDSRPGNLASHRGTKCTRDRSRGYCRTGCALRDVGRVTEGEVWENRQAGGACRMKTNSQVTNRPQRWVSSMLTESGWE
jgi:hypothetical protein